MKYVFSREVVLDETGSAQMELPAPQPAAEGVGPAGDTETVLEPLGSR